MKTSCLLLAISCLLSIFTLNSQADVTLTVEIDPPVDAGTVATVSVFASSNTGQQITGVNLPIDIGPAGTGLPPELSFFADPNDSIVNEIGGVPGGLNVSPTILTVNNTDAIANVTGFAPVSLTTSDTLLFDLLLNVDPAAGTGSFPVFINNGDTVGNGFSFSITDADNALIVFGPGDLTVNAGSVNIVAAVPEPSGLVLLTGTLAMVSLKRRRN